MPRKPAAKPAKPPGRPIPEGLVPLDVAAMLLDRSERALRRWLARGAPCVRVNGRTLFSMPALRKWAYAEGLVGSREPPGPRPKATTKASPTAPAEALEADRGRTLAELEAALASGGSLTSGERARVRDLLNLRKAKREKGKAAMAAAALRAQRAGLVDVEAVNRRLLRGAEGFRRRAAEMAKTRGQEWLDDALDVLDGFLAEAMPDLREPTQSQHPDAAH